MLTQEQALRTLRGLREALTLLETKGWTQGTAARDANGEPVPAESLEAACFCSLGALARVSSSVGFDFDLAADYATARQALVRAMPRDKGVAEFNDEATDFSEVRAMFQTAIKNLEAVCAE